MCWDVDPDTLQGECLAFCGGSENSPTCDEPGTTCVIANEGTLILCLPTCDPLEPTCDEGEGCYLLVDNDTQWACLPVGAPVMVSDGLLPAFCEPGTTAVDPALHAFCDPESEVCCGQICDVTAPACARPLQCVAAMEGSNAGVCVE